jgi:preprotein translocase subunit SecA
MTVGVISSLNDAERQVAYACDITYGTNNEPALRLPARQQKPELAHYVQRGHGFAIVTRWTASRIDEARTPSSFRDRPKSRRTREVDRIIPRLKAERSRARHQVEEREALRPPATIVDEKHKTVTLTESGMAKSNSCRRPAPGGRPAAAACRPHHHQPRAHAPLQADVD